MIEFFRDVLNGPLYIVVSIIAIILIMAIIGFIMERKKLEKEHNEEIAHISNPQAQNVVPIKPVNIEESKNNVTLEQPIINQSINNQVNVIQPITQQPEIIPITQINPTQLEQAVVNINEPVKNQDQA